MSKALSWTLGGSGLEAREVARDAARRQGKTLGEWLHGVIADEAADDGHADHDAASGERIRAVTARLERMRAGRRPTEGQRAHKGGRGILSQMVAEPSFPEETSFVRRALRESEGSNGAESRLEQAIDAMERSVARSERRTDDALTSLANMLATSERRRESERAGVASMAAKLSAIDARLSDPAQTPIKGALARLESRLDQIGRRSDAEASARLNALGVTDAQDASEPMRRLEEKLNAVLRAVASGEALPPTETSAVALAAARGQAAASAIQLPLRRRRLGEAIADIAQRQRALDSGRFPAPGRPAADGATGPVDDALAARLDDLRRQMSQPVPTAAGERIDFEALRRDITAMAEQLRDMAPRQAMTAIENRISQLASRVDAGQGEPKKAIDELRADVRQIGERIDAIARSHTPLETTARMQNRIEEMHDLVQRRLAQPAASDLSTIEHLVNDLGRRIEAVQAPGAGKSAIDALQRQIAMLASRLETTETGLASLATIERSMRDLFAHLEETRGLAERSAARAAHDAARGAAGEQSLDRPAQRIDLAVIEAMQEDVDRRTRATLDIVHETLDKVVDRLVALEHGLADARSRRAAPETPSPKDESVSARRNDLSLGAAEPILEPLFAGKPGSRRPGAPGDVGERPAGRSGKPDFIAAARRAAQTAQTDPTVAALRAPASEGPNVARAGLLARSRDYVASHKRPVLLALAAVLVVAATMALVQRLPLGTTGLEIAETTGPTQIASRPSAPAHARLGEMSPKAIAHAAPALAAQIPGSDPIMTGSIPSLPAFAARAGTPPQAPPALPAGLVKMAEAGDGAAAYTLASAFAEGRGAPRDYAHAAKLYAVAADQGVVPAQYRLGALYEKGLGVAQNKARARSLYRQAAEAGNPRAMHNLAVLLADGDGKPDYEGAATWFRKAAQYGVHDSEFNLAILLARGLGVDQSLVQSYQWFAVAAAQGDGDAASKRDEVGSKLSASEISVAKALAAAFRPRGPDPAATEVAPPPGGWDGETAPVRLNSARSKIS